MNSQILVIMKTRVRLR